MTSNRTQRITGIALALLFCGIGAGLIAYGLRMRVSPIYYKSGPQLFPVLVGGLTALVGVAALVSALKDKLLSETFPEMDAFAGILMAGGLLFQILTITWLGWIPTATVVLVAGAQAFRREKLPWDILVGLIVAVATYFFFSKLLGLRLPLGTLLS